MTIGQNKFLPGRPSIHITRHYIVHRGCLLKQIQENKEIWLCQTLVTKVIPQEEINFLVRLKKCGVLRRQNLTMIIIKEKLKEFLNK